MEQKVFTKDDVLRIIKDEYPYLSILTREQKAYMNYISLYKKVADVKLQGLLVKNINIDYVTKKHDDNITTLKGAIAAGFDWMSSEEGSEFWNNIQSRRDLETNKHIIDKHEPKKGDKYYYGDVSIKKGYGYVTWKGSQTDILRKNLNLIAGCKEDAIRRGKEVYDNLIKI